MQQRKLEVSIIVVNWNGERLLSDCLNSLIRQTYRDREIILVDNGSKDGSIQLVKNNFPGIKLEALSENRGFTGGNWAGFKLARGEFIALVNNDTRVDERWLENLIQPLFQQSNVGICASKILFDDGRTINSAADGITTAAVGFNCGLGSDSALFSDSVLAFGGCGAAIIYRRRMLEEIGFLDEDFFLYDEDTDLNFRAQLAAWQCVYVPTAIVYHKSNASSGRLSDLHVYYHTRNLEFVWIKNMPMGLMFRFAHHKLFQELGSFFYLCLRHGKWAPFFKAKRDALKMLPLMLQKRKDIQAKRKVSNRYLRAAFSSMFTLRFLKQKSRQLVRG